MVTNCLRTMRKVYQTCVKEVLILDTTMAKYFRPLGSTRRSTDQYGGNNHPQSFTVLNRQMMACGKCSQPMDLREHQSPEVVGVDVGERGQERNAFRYLFCHTCLLPLPLPRNGEFSPKVSAGGGPFLCAICKFQVLDVSTDGKKHNVCPYCFRYCCYCDFV